VHTIIVQRGVFLDLTNGFADPAFRASAELKPALDASSISAMLERRIVLRPLRRRCAFLRWGSRPVVVVNRTFDDGAVGSSAGVEGGEAPTPAPSNRGGVLTPYSLLGRVQPPRASSGPQGAAARSASRTASDRA